MNRPFPPQNLLRKVRAGAIALPELEEPIRAELLSGERLEQHAESLAVAQRVTTPSRAGRQEADMVADGLLGLGGRAAEPATTALQRLEGAPLAPAFAVQLDQRLCDQGDRRSYRRRRAVHPKQRWRDLACGSPARSRA